MDFLLVQLHFTMGQQKLFITGENKSDIKLGKSPNRLLKKRQYTPPTAQEFKELESENGQLKQILGEKDMEIAILRDLIKKSQPGYRTKLR